MKYRVRLDISYNEKSDAQALMDTARNSLLKASNINEYKSNKEISYCDMHQCGHDEGKPCIDREREELLDKKVVTIS